MMGYRNLNKNHICYYQVQSKEYHSRNCCCDCILQCNRNSCCMINTINLGKRSGKCGGFPPTTNTNTSLFSNVASDLKISFIYFCPSGKNLIRAFVILVLSFQKGLLLKTFSLLRKQWSNNVRHSIRIQMN